MIVPLFLSLCFVVLPQILDRLYEDGKLVPNAYNQSASFGDFFTGDVSKRLDFEIFFQCQTRPSQRAGFKRLSSFMAFTLPKRSMPLVAATTCLRPFTTPCFRHIWSHFWSYPSGTAFASNHQLLLHALFSSMAKSYRRNFIKTQGDEVKSVFLKLVFCTWDFGVSQEKAQNIQRESITNQLKVHLMMSWFSFY